MEFLLIPLADDRTPVWSSASGAIGTVSAMDCVWCSVDRSFSNDCRPIGASASGSVDAVGACDRVRLMAEGEYAKSN